MGNTEIITISGLTKSYGTHLLWSDIELQVGAGEMLAVRGVSGSGKSTLLHCIGLLEQPDSGSVKLLGVEASSSSSRAKRMMRQSVIGYLFQDYALVESCSVQENIDIAARPRLWMKRINVEDVLKKVGLEGRSADPVHTLSGGEQQRVALARLLVKPSRIIVADEPTAALDEANEAMVMGMLRELADGGRAVIVATHSDTVADHCDRIFTIPELEPVPLRRPK
ncbi:ATP-binding cassette domain-containing protein [Austwickia chelonae]|uniref:ATP-binding cassette domain-containing protein n=1 Tax=Austwickia chelonae TaxID=100225 RepID=UPI00196858CE|nr:ATP-binding cassette domain-containing protein [Austwickia chelonae]